MVSIRKKIDSLIQNANIKSYKSLLIKIYQELGDKNAYEKAEKEKANFTKMLNGERELNTKYYIPLERILNIRIADLLSGTEKIAPTYYPKGIRYTAATNSYEKFDKLARESIQDGKPILFTYCDEYDKGIVDYIIEFRAINGIRYLVDNYDIKYNITIDSIRAKDFYLFATANDAKKVADLLFEFDNGELFTKVFYAYDMLLDSTNTKNIYYQNDFLKKVLNSKNIFESCLRHQEIEYKDINYTYAPIDNKQHSVCVYINPILNRLLEVAFENSRQYASQIRAILEYGIKWNKIVIEEAKRIDNNRGEVFLIKDNGAVVYRNINCGSLIVLKEEIIHLEITNEIKDKIEAIKTINNTLLLRQDENIFGIPHIQRNEQGNILMLHTQNTIEYELYRNLGQDNLPIPKLLSTKDGVDEFEKYIGQNDCYQYTDAMLGQIGAFVKNLHDSSVEYKKDKVYIHGNLAKENVYFENSVLTSVVNWNNCHIGDRYEDLAFVLLQFTNVEKGYRNTTDVLKKMQAVLQGYVADEKYKKELVEYIRIHLKKQLDKLNLNDDSDIMQYEKVKWIELFFEIYATKLIKGEDKNDE